MELLFKRKEENIIYFEDIEWLEQIPELEVRFRSHKELGFNPVINNTTDEMNSNFKMITVSFIRFIEYVMEKLGIPFVINYSDELLEIKLFCFKQSLDITKNYPPVHYERVLIIGCDIDGIYFTYPDDFDTEFLTETPIRLDSDNTFPVRGIIGREFSNQTIELIMKNFILGTEIQSKKIPYHY